MLLEEGEAPETDESRMCTEPILGQGQKPAMSDTTLRQLTKPNSEPLRIL